MSSPDGSAELERFSFRGDEKPVGAVWRYMLELAGVGVVDTAR